jgi:hypothetical protein
MEEHCYAQCHLWGLSLMVSVTNKPFRLSVIMLNVVVLSVVVLSVVAPFALISEYFLSKLSIPLKNHTQSS